MPEMPEEPLAVPLVELDAELKTLSSMARHFLSSQGLATAEAFLSTNTAMTANALMDWRKQCDFSECATKTDRFCICSWKKKLRQVQSSEWQQTELQEHTAAAETMHDALSHRVSAVTAMGKAAKDDNASNDFPSYQHHGDFKGAEPRDGNNEQIPDSKKRKRSRDESSPKKHRVFRYT
jgi:hypothetical protein